MKGVIYKITNRINKKIYIGQTTNLSKRWATHQREAQNWKHDNSVKKQHKYRSLLYTAMAKYGVTNFTIEIIDKGNSKSELDVLEKYWIQTLDSRNPNKGYNIAEGGSGGKLNLGKKFSKEICQKISLGKKDKNVGKIHIHKGNTRRVVWPDQLEEFLAQGYSTESCPKKPLTQEAKRKQRLALENRSPEDKEMTRQKRSARFSGKNNPMFGKVPWNKDIKLPDVTKKKISISRKNRQIPSPTRGKIAIHKNTVTKYISTTDLTVYLKQGYVLGGGPRQRRIIKEKKI